MALPVSPNSISLNQVNVELGLGGTTSINLNQATVRTLELHLQMDLQRIITVEQPLLQMLGRTPLHQLRMEVIVDQDRVVGLLQPNQLHSLILLHQRHIMEDHRLPQSALQMVQLRIQTAVQRLP